MGAATLHAAHFFHPQQTDMRITHMRGGVNKHVCRWPDTSMQSTDRAPHKQAGWEKENNSWTSTSDSAAFETLHTQLTVPGGKHRLYLISGHVTAV